MKRVLSLVLALVLVLGMIPTFAADMTGAEHLKEHAFISGDENGDLMVDNMLTRQQLAAIIAELNGVKEEASEFALPPAYADVAKIGGWAKPFVAYAQVNEWMTGKPGNLFDPLNGVPAQQLAAVILNVLGYEFTWDTALTVAADLGIEIDANGVLTRGEAFEALWVAVSEVPMNTEAGLTLGVHLGKLEPAVVAPTVLAVSSVSALNTKQFTVVFNKAVDATTAETPANYTVGGVAFGDAALQADGKTVVITMATDTKVLNASEVTIVVKKAIKDADGVALAADYTQKITVVDTTSPVVSSIKAVGAKTLQITFAEPVIDNNILPGDGFASLATSQFEVKSGIYTYAITAATADFNNNTVTLTLGTNLIAGDIVVKVNKLGMSDAAAIRDFAGLVVVPTTQTYAYVADTTVATATLTSVNKATGVAKVTFSKPVYGTSVKLYHSVNGTDAYGTAAVTKNEAGASTEWSFTFTNPLPSGALTFYLANDSVAANQISDLFGVKVPNQTFTFTVVADTTAPSVSKLTVNANTSIDIDFSEAVNTTEQIKAANFEILKPDGTALSFTASAVDADTTRLTATLVDNTTYTVNVKAMKDIAGNAMAAAYTGTALVADNSNPTLTQAYITDASTLYLVFSEPMNETDLANKANYVIDGSALVTADTVTVVSSTKVKITIAAADLAATKAVVVGAVKDLAGKKLTSDSAFSTTFAGGMTSDTLTYTVQLVAKNKLKLKFNKELAAFNPSEFAPSASSWLSIESNTVVSGKTEIVLVLADAQAANAVVTVTATAGTTKSTEGTAVTAGAVASTDKVAPTFTAEWINATTIHVVFDEPVEADYFGAVGTHGFSVTGGLLDSALMQTPGTDGTIVVLTSLNAVAGDAFTKNSDVTYAPGFVQDLSGNTVVAATITDEITSAAGKAVAALETAAALDLSNDTNNAAVVTAKTAADTAVNALPAGATKTALAARVTTAYAFKTASDTAEALVVTAEASSAAAVAAVGAATVTQAKTDLTAVAYTGANAATTTALTARFNTAKASVVAVLTFSVTGTATPGATATVAKTTNYMAVDANNLTGFTQNLAVGAATFVAATGTYSYVGDQAATVVTFTDSFWGVTDTVTVTTATPNVTVSAN